MKVKQQLQDKQIREKGLYDKSSKTLLDLQPGDCVRMRNEVSKTWEPAHVVKESNQPRSYIVRSNNSKLYRRNRRDILKTREKFQENCEIELPSNPDPTPSAVRSSVENGNDSSVMVSNQEPPSVQHPYSSRVSGRIIRKPSRYND